jgi:hypothetical protein
LNAFISNFLEPVSYLVYTIALFIQWHNNRSGKIRILTVYYILATLLMGYASLPVFYLYSTSQNNNNWVYNLFYFLTIFFLTFYMYQNFITARSKIISLALLLVNVINFFLNDLIFKQQLFNSFATSVSFLSLILLIFLYFQQVLRNVTEWNILLDFDFWLISGYLLYFLGSFFIIIFWSELSSQVVLKATKVQQDQFNLLWSVHNILLFLSAVIALISSIWIRSYQKKLH